MVFLERTPAGVVETMHKRALIDTVAVAAEGLSTTPGEAIRQSLLRSAGVTFFLPYSSDRRL